MRWGWRQFGWFFGIGIWLGIIVIDGATYLLVALVLSVGLPLVESNAMKTVLLIPTTIIAMLVFTYEGQIDWRPGMVMALGSIAGGVAGARLAGTIRGSKWIVYLLYAVLVGEILHLVTHYALTVI